MDVEVVEELRFVLEVRVKDVIFVFDWFKVFKLVKVGFVGSLFGGLVVVVVMRWDGRIVVGVNFDGGMFGVGVVEGGVVRLFLIFGVDGYNIIIDEIWGWFWDVIVERRFGLWMKELSVVNVMYRMFLDFLLVGEVSEELRRVGFGGVVSGVWVMEMMMEYLVDFFWFVLMGKGEGLFVGESGRFFEVKFLRL